MNTNDNNNVPEQEQIALYDMDQTLCDYTGRMEECLDSLSSPNEESYTVDWGKDVPPHIERRMDLIKSQPGWWESLPILRLGMDIFHASKNIGFTNHILTKGPYKTDSAWSEKRRWCKAHLLAGTPLTITEDKGLMYGKVLVDDYPPYVERWLKWRSNGLVIMPAHSYNEDFEHPNVIRYDGENRVQIVDALRAAFSRKPGEKLTI